MKIFPLTIYVLLKPFIQILPSDSNKSLWDSRTTATLVMESSLARLGSGSSRNFLLLLEKLEPKNQLSLIGSTEKNSGLKSLIFHDLQSAF
jgi:hypothetical protein